MLGKVDSMMPGDMPDFDPGLQMADQALTEPARSLTTKHVIVISDGDPAQSNRALLQQMKNHKVTVSTVGVATHGSPQDQALGTIAKATGGRFYSVKSPRALPSIYIKETRIVSQSFVYEKAFQPRLLFKAGPTEKLPDALSSLYGFVRTTPKVSPLVQMPILAPSSQGQDFPVLAFWQYGLGKAAAFTSDARSRPGRPAWDRDWAQSDIYLKFWEQLLDWSLRSVETGRFTMSTQYQDGKVVVTVEARDKDNHPLTDLTIRGGVSAPAGFGDDPNKPPARLGPLKFEQKNSGVYVAEVKADEAGSYFINAQSVRPVKEQKAGKDAERQEVDSVRAGVTVPYSPEFADMESNAPLLERLRAVTGGQTYEDSDSSLHEAAANGDLFRHTGLPPSRNMQPIWHWLLLATGILLFFDVANRRIAVVPEEVAGKLRRVWERLRRREAAVSAAPQFLDRLKSRKAAVAETIAKGSRRFEGEPATSAPPPGAAEALAESATSAPAPKPMAPAQKEAEAADYASRLMKAKRRVWEDRDK
jgi:hypothetical protein